MVNCVTGTRGGGAGIPSCRVLRSAAPETPGAAKVLQVDQMEDRAPSRRAARGSVPQGQKSGEVFRERGG